MTGRYRKMSRNSEGKEKGRKRRERKGKGWREKEWKIWVRVRIEMLNVSSCFLRL